MAADGPGPDYCRACRKRRGSEDRCEGCTEPEILPETAPGLELYLAAQTQWRYGGMGTPTGLDYAGVEALSRLRGEPITSETFGYLQVAERAALEAFVERQGREQIRR